MGIEEDVKEMLRLLEADKKYTPFELHIADEMLTEMGYDPKDYSELMPGIRIVRANETRDR